MLSLLVIFFNYGFILLSFKMFGKIGLFMCIPVVLIIANVQVVITTDLFGWAVTLGNVAYVSSYLITDLIGEIYDKRSAQKAVIFGFMSLFIVTVLMNLILLVTPAPDSIAAHESVAYIFGLLPRIFIGSITAFAVSQTLDVAIFARLKAREGDKKLWIRNNVSTITSQVIDGLVFTFIAFYGVFPIEVVFEIFVTTYIIKTIVATLDTPFMYLGVWLHKKGYVKEI